MSFSDITNIAVSGLVAQRTRMTVTASNIANANTTRTEEGGAYRRRDPVFTSSDLGKSFGSTLDQQLHGVDVDTIEEDAREALTRFDPGHPDADEEGYVEIPRVNIVEELTNMMSASRSYEANLLTMKKVTEMKQATLMLGKG